MAKRKAVRRKRRGRAGAAMKKAKRPAKRATRKAARRPVKRTSKKGRAEKKAKRGTATELLTLTEVSKRTGISMPTLQRYKKEYQGRLKTVGKGRTQRYKVESLATFQQIKQENLKKRGRPRKAARTRASGRATGRGARPDNLISLSEIGRRTGISYPTLLRYVRLHGKEIPSYGTGRKRRFPVAAVPVFSRLRQQSRRGRRKGVPAKKPRAAARGVEARLRRIEKSQIRLERQMEKLIAALRRPLVRGV